jgi:cytidylate kinase
MGRARAARARSGRLPRLSSATASRDTVAVPGGDLAGLDRGVDLGDGPGLVALVADVSLAADATGRLTRVRVAGLDVTEHVRDADVDRHVSTVARLPAVRAALLPRQREIAASGRIIMAGRDIGTVVLPDADLRLWLEVSVEERARRRAAERGVSLESPEGAAILADLRRRDEVDSTRVAAPLRIRTAPRSSPATDGRLTDRRRHGRRDPGGRHAGERLGRTQRMTTGPPREPVITSPARPWACASRRRLPLPVPCLRPRADQRPRWPAPGGATHRGGQPHDVGRSPFVAAWLQPALGRPLQFLAKEQLFVPS